MLLLHVAAQNRAMHLRHRCNETPHRRPAHTKKLSGRVCCTVVPYRRLYRRVVFSACDVL